MDQQEQITPTNKTPQEENIIGPAEDKPTPIQPTKTPKNNKALIWCLSVLTAISLVVAGVFAYLYFVNPSNENKTVIEEQDKDQNQDQPSEPISEEVEITDTYTLRDLDEKIAILHNTTEKNAYFNLNPYIYGQIKPLYVDGDLSEIAKLTHIVGSIQPDRTLTYDEQKTITEKEDLMDGEVTEGVNADTVISKYLDVFGETPNKTIVDEQRYCPKVQYSAEYDFYYLINRCGGTGPLTARIYKNKYTSDANHAYVYVSVSTLNGEDGKIYCDYIADLSNLPSVCNEEINESNYQDFAQYRFVFDKSDDGTYYFDEVEKL